MSLLPKMNMSGRYKCKKHTGHLICKTHLEAFEARVKLLGEGLALIEQKKTADQNLAFLNQKMALEMNRSDLSVHEKDSTCRSLFAAFQEGMKRLKEFSPSPDQKERACQNFTFANQYMVIEPHGMEVMCKWIFETHISYLGFQFKTLEMHWKRMREFMPLKEEKEMGDENLTFLNKNVVPETIKIDVSNAYICETDIAYLRSHYNIFETRLKRLKEFLARKEHMEKVKSKLHEKARLNLHMFGPMKSHLNKTDEIQRDTETLEHGPTFREADGIQGRCLSHDWKNSKVFGLKTLLLILVTQVNIGLCEIVVHPRDTETVVGQMTYLNCSISDPSKGVNWYYYSVGSDRRTYMHLLGNYKTGTRIETSTIPGGFNLVIQSVQRSDAGKYVCQEIGEHGKESSAELIVLGETPLCESNIAKGVIGTNNCGLEPDELVLSCQATYHGNTPPILKWNQDGKDLVVSQRNDSGRVSSQLSVNLISNNHGSNFICQTTRSPVENHSCSKSVKVISALNNYLTAEKKEGEEAACLLNGSLPCTYKWICSENGHEDMVSNNQNTTFSQPGLYRCEAECTIREKRCLLVAGLVKVESVTRGESKSLVAFFVVAFLLCLAGTIIFASLWFDTRKKLRAQQNKNDENNRARDPEEMSVLNSTNHPPNGNIG